jgi:uncharacterized protein YcbX
MTDTVGVVEGVWRFPVKSMRGEQLDAAQLTDRGFAGDRVYALVDAETGKVLSGKTPRLGPNLLGCHAGLVGSTGGGEPIVRITLADGATITTDSQSVDGFLSDFLGCKVHLHRAAPADFTIDQYHPDIEGADPEGHRDTVTEAKLGSAFFEQAGLPSAVPPGAFFDLFPVSVITTSTLDRLHDLEPDSRFDERRFRMNVVVRANDKGFVENDWPGRTVQVGDDARVSIMMPDPRCVMTTVQQDDLPKDNGVLRALARHNRLDVAGAPYPCAGVYGVVESAGVVRRGDPVVLA